MIYFAQLPTGSNPCYGMSLARVESKGIWTWLVFDGIESWRGEASSEEQAMVDMEDSFEGQFGPRLDPQFALAAYYHAQEGSR